MSSNLDAFQALLATMRDEFLEELPERCDRCDELILTLENPPFDHEAFNDLFRSVHSLKGSGGTHGLGIITTICHQLENLLTETNERRGFSASFATRALAYVDLLRQVAALARRGKPDYSVIEGELDRLRLLSLQSRKTGLIVESSTMMSGLYQKALEKLPLQLMQTDNGLSALDRLLREPFDFIIVGGELKDLNGIALMAALRASNKQNQNIPAILVSSQRISLPEHVRFNASISRDQNLARNLLETVQTILSL